MKGIIAVEGSRRTIDTCMPHIDDQKCDGCGVCVTVCSCKALLIVDNKAKYDGSEKCGSCTRWCGNCELVCPQDAISCPFEIRVEE